MQREGGVKHLVIDNTEGEFWVADRVQKIQQVVGKYEEFSFSISFSGGKDSCVVSRLIDEALPNNQIPRVFINTGIEYGLTVRFVKSLAAKDKRIVIVNAGVNVPQMLQAHGYPFKSKDHAKIVSTFQSGKGRTSNVQNYLTATGRFSCPKQLRYQFDSKDAMAFKVSDKCCFYLKENPLRIWQRENGKSWYITGLMNAEGGRRVNAGCLSEPKGNKAGRFNPLFPMSNDWEDWYISSRNIQLSELYAPPLQHGENRMRGLPVRIVLAR